MYSAPMLEIRRSSVALLTLAALSFTASLSLAAAPAKPIVLRAARMFDGKGDAVVAPGLLVVDGNKLVAVGKQSRVPAGAEVINLGDVTLLPGLMDMELNLVIGGPFSGNTRPDVEESPAFKTLRGVKNARTTLDAGFTTVRNLGLFQKTGGILLDIDLARAVKLG